MPRGLSSTILPAIEVKTACELALAEIEREQAKCRDTVVKEFRKTKMFCTPERALLIMPGHMKLIFEQYREHDRAVLRALKSLSKAAHEANQKFTVEITADDFRLLEMFYKKG